MSRNGWGKGVCHIPARHRPNDSRVRSLEKGDGGQDVRLRHVDVQWVGQVLKHRVRERPSAQEEGRNCYNNVEINREGLVLESTKHLSWSYM